MLKAKIKNKKESLGITLVALVVTIVVLLILLAVTLNLVLGENGIINLAKRGKSEYGNSIIQEQEELNSLYAQAWGNTVIENLPENNSQNPQEAGKQVALKAGWGTPAVKTIKTSNGVEVTEVTEVATVYAVSVGNGETVPVPIGFYYVGGTLSSGVVISDNINDKNKHAGKADVPAGAVYNSDGTVKNYLDSESKPTTEYNNLTEEQKKNILLGNQFVWIPCEAGNYKKINFGVGNSTTAYDTETNGAEIAYIQKYGGFYVGRYEAGTSNITFANSKTLESPTGTSNWANSNYTLDKVISGKITEKAGEIPYFHADYKTAVEMSGNMYNTDYVQSGLVTGTMWDMIMKFISKETDYSDVKETKWGNYNVNNDVVTFSEDVGRWLSVGSNGTESGTFIKKAGWARGIRTTASSETVKKNNLYDIAGNLWEWTQEMCYKSDNLALSYVLRGGAFNGTNSPACSRLYTIFGDANTNVGFRPVLYIK